MLRPLLLAVVLSAAVPALATNAPPPPDPLDDPLLITAGFLDHHPDLRYRVAGMKAMKARRYEEAYQYFRRAAFHADKPSQGMVAEMLWEGRGVARDRALAYAWMDLAAERGYRGFLGLRETYWAALTEDERARALAEGKAIYARFGDEAAKPRYEFQLRVGRRNLTGSRTGFNHGVKIDVPGPGGSQTIEGSRFYDERYWDAKKYWAWHDAVWMKPRIGKVSVGAIDTIDAAASRIPDTAPAVDAKEPEAPEAPPVP
jgi:hypothetical protein